MPDVWRNWRVNTLFRKFHASLPLNLLLSSNQPIAGWHYIDEPYPTHSCHVINPTNIVWVLNKLEPDLHKATTDDSRALLMVLVAHFIGDAHQPLHTFTNVFQSCEGDKGGNTFCLRENKKGKCSKNLHALWDSAVGYLKPHENIQQMAYELQQLYPQSQFAQLLLDTNPADWIKNNYQYANFIYDLPEYTRPSPDYYRSGQAIAKKQLTLAGYRLADELNKSLLSIN